MIQQAAAKTSASGAKAAGQRHMRLRRRGSALGRDCGEGEEAGAGSHERRDQGRCRERIPAWVGKGEAEGEQRVEDEIERDVEEGAAVGGNGGAGDFAVETVGQPVGGEQGQTPERVPQRNGGHDGEAQREARKGHVVGPDAARGKCARGRPEEPGGERLQGGVEHVLPTLDVLHGASGGRGREKVNHAKAKPRTHRARGFQFSDQTWLTPERLSPCRRWR